MTTPSSSHVSSGTRSHLPSAQGPHLEWLARLGLIARGVVYLLIGFLALQIALSGSNKEMDQEGAFHYVAAQPLGQFMLWALAFGLFAYGLWRLVQAITGDVDDPDPDHKTRERVVDAVKAVIYFAFAFTAGSIAAKAGSSGSTGFTADLMKETGGQLLVGAVGVVIVGVGLYMVWQGWSTDFEKVLDTSSMGATTHRVVVLLGRVGYIARGVVFALFGIFVVVAAVNFDPKKAESLDVALSAIARAPAGPVLLALAAAGLVAFGLYSFADSKYHRV